MRDRFVRSGSPFVPLLAALVALGCAGCGDTRAASDAGRVLGDAGELVDGGSVAVDSGSGSPDGGGPVGGPGATARFWPDIPIEYGGSIAEPGIEITAFTIYEPILGPTYLVRFDNVSTDLRLCSMDMTTRFMDAAGVEIGIAQGLVEGLPHRGVSGTGGLVRCVSPGQTGMQSAPVDLLSGYGVEDIASATWSVGAINLTDAVPTSDLQVSGIMRVDSLSAYRLRGTFTNLASDDVRSPSVSAFGVNAVGRPIMEASDFESLTLSPGGTWSFETSLFQEIDYVDVVAFPDASD